MLLLNLSLASYSSKASDLWNFWWGGKALPFLYSMFHCPAKFFCIAVEVYEAHAKTCTFLECLLVPYLCVFYCDVVELGSYGNLKYYDTMTEEGKKYFRIIRISIFRSLTLSVFSVFCLFVCLFFPVFNLSITEWLLFAWLHWQCDQLSLFFQVFIFNISALLLSDKEIQQNVFIKEEYTCKTTLIIYTAQYNVDCESLFYVMFYNAFRKVICGC